MTLKPSDQSHTQHSSAACVMIMMQLQREEVRKRIQKGERRTTRKEGETGGIFLHYTVPCLVSIRSIVPHPLQLVCIALPGVCLQYYIAARVNYQVSWFHSLNSLYRHSFTLLSGSKIPLASQWEM